MLVCSFYSQLFRWDFQFFPLGQSYLYTSLSEKYPGPSSEETKSNTKQNSPRTLSVALPRGENVSILFQGDNRSKLNQCKSLIWCKLLISYSVNFCINTILNLACVSKQDLKISYNNNFDHIIASWNRH